MSNYIYESKPKIIRFTYGIVQNNGGYYYIENGNKIKEIYVYAELTDPEVGISPVNIPTPIAEEGYYFDYWEQGFNRYTTEELAATKWKDNVTFLAYMRF